MYEVLDYFLSEFSMAWACSVLCAGNNRGETDILTLLSNVLSKVLPLFSRNMRDMVLTYLLSKVNTKVYFRKYLRR